MCIFTVVYDAHMSTQFNLWNPLMEYMNLITLQHMSIEHVVVYINYYILDKYIHL